MELVSIIVPIYNVEKYINGCVESIRKQTYRNIEIILIDDGSLDNSGRICDALAKEDKRIVVKHIKNQGVSVARNIGLEMAEGEYITFVDGDDQIECHLIEKMVAAMNDNHADCVTCSSIKIYDNKDDSFNVPITENIRVYGKEEIISELLYMGQPFYGTELTAVWGTLYKKELIGQMQFNTKMKIAEDFVFKYQYLLKIEKAVCLEFPGYHYLIRESSAMRRGFDRRNLKTIVELQNLINRTEDKQYLDGIISRAVNIGFVILFMMPVDKIYEEERKEVIYFIKCYRKKALLNPKTRLKVKAAIMLSFLGFDLTQKIFEKSS